MDKYCEVGKIRCKYLSGKDTCSPVNVHFERYIIKGFKRCPFEPQEIKEQTFGEQVMQRCGVGEETKSCATLINEQLAERKEEWIDEYFKWLKFLDYRPDEVTRRNKLMEIIE